MSQENVEIVRAIFEGFGRKDIEGVLKLVPHDFEFDFSRSRGPESGVFRGRERIKRFLATLSESFSVIEPVETEIIDAGEVIVRVGGFRARGEASGVEVSAIGATVWTFSGDMPVSARLYQTKAEALEAAGLSE